MQAAEIVAACLEAWASKDLEGTLAYFSDDVRYTLHVDERSIGLAGTAVGKSELRARLKSVLDVFDFLAYVVEAIRPSGDVVRTSIVYYYRHKASRMQLEGRYRHVLRVRDGKIVEGDEYHDAASFEAFMALASQS